MDALSQFPFLVMQSLLYWSWLGWKQESRCKLHLDAGFELQHGFRVHNKSNIVKYELHQWLHEFHAGSAFEIHFFHQTFDIIILAPFIQHKRILQKTESKSKIRIPKVGNVHSNTAQKLKALSGVGLFFLFNKTFNSCFDVNFFGWKVLVVWVWI
jgi:hypothetical protein